MLKDSALTRLFGRRLSATAFSRPGTGMGKDEDGDEQRPNCDSFRVTSFTMGAAYIRKAYISPVLKACHPHRYEK